MKSLIQLISQNKNSQSSIEELVSDDFLESSLREIKLQPSSEENIQQWLNVLAPGTTSDQPKIKLLKLNFTTFSQIAAAIVVGVSLAIFTPQLSSTSTTSLAVEKSNSTTQVPTKSIQLADSSASISNEDIALAKTWAQESVQTQSAGIYTAPNGALYHAVEFNYLELPTTNSGDIAPKLQRKTEYIFIPVEETY